MKWYFLFIMSFFLVGCSETVLIVGDNYVDIIDNWGLDSGLFRFRARLRGKKIIHGTADGEFSLTDMIAELAFVPDIVILSPWNAHEAKRPVLRSSRIIIAGGEPPAGSGENVIGTVMDKMQALADIGRLAASMALEQEKPALVLYSDNISELFDAYNDAVQEEFAIIEVKSSGRMDETLPNEFAGKAADASVLIFLAGPLNIEAFKATQDMQQPVITEFALAGGYWNSRIIASIESDSGRMREVLVSAMNKKVQQSSIYYPGKLKM
ncbi:MAG: hypothetical protein B0D92_08775 [Spirochaeta sp. LUC14_002_19_P3]|nr:MAG: hypothetical protein B0D92_08775 [Spirochaeta sp. LUC14_002_19_P3]